jgi:hypothetical protein
VFYPDGVIRRELESFEYVYSRTGIRYSAPEGFHDDAVCALAQAHRCRMQHRGLDVWEALGRKTAARIAPQQTQAARQIAVNRFS